MNRLTLRRSTLIFSRDRELEEQGAFTSMMSALTDLLAQASKPDTAKAPHRGALEEVRKYLKERLNPAAAARCPAPPTP